MNSHYKKTLVALLSTALVIPMAPQKIEARGNTNNQVDVLNASSSDVLEAVENLETKIITTNAVGLEWDFSAHAKRYIVLRDGQQIYDGVWNFFLDTNLTEGTEYTYEVIAVDEKGNSQSTVVKAQTYSENSVTLSDIENLQYTLYDTKINLNFDIVDGDSFGVIYGEEDNLIHFYKTDKWEDTDAMELTISGLKPNTSHTFVFYSFSEDDISPGKMITVKTLTDGATAPGNGSTGGGTTTPDNSNQNENVANPTGAFFKTNEETEVYDNRTGSLVKAGTLLKGQTFKIVKDYGANWWQISFGDHYGYVAKHKVTQVGNQEYSNTHNLKATKQTATFTADKTEIYDNTSGTLVPFATIAKGRTYPVLTTMGNWVGIDINGRLGYVHNSKVSVSGTTSSGSSNTAPAPSTPSATGKYIKAKVDTPIYDNRTGALDEFATLLKGQSLEIVKDYGANWWQVKWGNTYGYIAKSKVEQISNKEFKNVDPTMKTSTTTFIVPTQDNVPVMDNTSGSLVQFASLKENHRYPIIRTMGNWYIIDIGGRYGYVHNSKAVLGK